MKDYLEAGAVRYRPQREEGVREGHIHKKAARNKALEVVFDPKDHKCGHNVYQRTALHAACTSARPRVPCHAD